ncbi:hypothetical protein P9250_03715 [Caballeronia sp. LP006]|jgi:hypothetical protein|uniref:hypothetical protein n=1 Tax=unclassified Caballeronia TaxID=2646786 RepID=UPI001FD37BB4|nr:MULTISPECIES: hypothetical protein [unclassified Caballeronia]MDR5774188.1 hypothetical protein [Caballeronia sp. LZ002]MDR5805721.1 hypothetical protein [Caballeronia sp. LZ001]MDR5826965.1 hypothetical protein [Caballeronia sp. LP006]MDR5849623.1 hypothetical protein [Caballeronia sp. LZ003]
MSRSTVTYRGYELVIKNASNGVAQCWAWKDQKAAFKETGETLDDAERTVRAAIDAEMGPATGAGDAAVDAYIAAFKAILPVSEGQRKMLVAHYQAPARTITAMQLAKAAGYASYRGANVQYGNLGKLIYEQHPVDLPRRPRDNSLIFTYAIADPGAVAAGSVLEGYTEEHEAEWSWPMRAAVAQALVALGIVKA